MQLVNGAQFTQFFNITFLFVLFAAAPAPAVLLTDIFPLTSIYASHKLDFSIAVLNLICLLGEYAPVISSFILT